MTARTRLLLGLAGVVGTAAVVRRDRLGPRESRIFRAANDLPDRLYGPLWTMMQAGALGAAPVAAGAACAAGRPRLARRLLADGVAAWLLAKGVKRFAQRPRPVVLLPDTRCRGPEAAGLGYVSGHAAVITAMTAAALPHLRGRARLLALGLGPVVGLARMYVGAHLPLDVVGGAALGLATDAVLCLAAPAEAGRPARAGAGASVWAIQDLNL